MPKQIFLSHSSQDSAFAILLASEMERAFSDGIQVFASSRPDAIPSGSDWLENVINNLEKSDGLIILLTESSVNSTWVGFELGFFWKQRNRTNIYTLHHPSMNVPSPLDTLQAKRITDEVELQSVINQISVDMDVSFSGDLSFSRLILASQNISSPPSQRTLAIFETYLDIYGWDKILDGLQESWICQEDVLYQIEIDHADIQEFREEWIKLFPTHRKGMGNEPAQKVFVRLKIAGTTVRIFQFISVDGGRYFVPLPEIDSVNDDGTRNFYWDWDSLIMRVAYLVGDLYHVHPTWASFANFAAIELRNYP